MHAASMQLQKSKVVPSLTDDTISGKPFGQNCSQINDPSLKATSHTPLYTPIKDIKQASMFRLKSTMWFAAFCVLAFASVSEGSTNQCLVGATGAQRSVQDCPEESGGKCITATSESQLNIVLKL